MLSDQENVKFVPEGIRLDGVLYEGNWVKSDNGDRCVLFIMEFGTHIEFHPGHPDYEKALFAFICRNNPENREGYITALRAGVPVSDIVV